MSPDPPLSLAEGLERSGLSVEQLWLGYAALGGDAGELEVEAYVLGLLSTDPYQHDVIAQALNESFLDRGLGHPVGYWPDHAR